MSELDSLPPIERRGLRSESYTGEALPGSDYTDEERVFLVAMERYKREQRRPYPTWREVLHVVQALGYRRGKDEG